MPRIWPVNNPEPASNVGPNRPEFSNPCLPPRIDRCPRVSSKVDTRFATKNRIMFQGLADWGARRGGRLGSVALNVGAALNAASEAFGTNDLGAAVGEGNIKGAAFAIITMLPGEQLGKLAKVGKAERTLAGVYEFVAETGERYIGQSKDIFRRLRQHLKSGKLSQVEDALIYPMPGSSKLERELLEQSMIDEAGGVKNLRNSRNSVGESRRTPKAQ